MVDNAFGPKPNSKLWRNKVVSNHWFERATPHGLAVSAWRRYLRQYVSALRRVHSFTGVPWILTGVMVNGAISCSRVSVLEREVHPRVCFASTYIGFSQSLRLGRRLAYGSPKAHYTVSAFHLPTCPVKTDGSNVVFVVDLSGDTVLGC